MESNFVLFVTPVVSVNTVSKFHNILLHYIGKSCAHVSVDTRSYLISLGLLLVVV